VQCSGEGDFEGNLLMVKGGSGGSLEKE